MLACEAAETRQRPLASGLWDRGLPTAQAQHNPHIPDKSAFTTREVADLIGCSEGSLRVSRCDRAALKGPHHTKTGHRVEYAREDLVQ